MALPHQLTGAEDLQPVVGGKSGKICHETTDLYGSLVLKLLSLRRNLRESRAGPERGCNTEVRFCLPFSGCHLLYNLQNVNIL